MPFLLVILCAKARDPWPGGVACLASWLACSSVLSSFRHSGGGELKRLGLSPRCQYRHLQYDVSDMTGQHSHDGHPT